MAAVLFALCLVGIGSACAQAAQGCVQGKEPYLDARTVVRAVLSEPDGFHSTFVENPLVRLGDSASVGVIQLCTEKQLSDPVLMAKVLSMIRAAFARPCAIDQKGDRTPNATLLLLHFLAGQTKEANLQRRIAATAEYVRRAASRNCADSRK